MQHLSAIWEKVLAVPNTLKLHCVKLCGMTKISMSETDDGDFSVVDIYPSPGIDNDGGIISTNADEINICVDDENSVNFFIGACVLVIYEENCYPEEIKSLQSNGC